MGASVPGRGKSKCRYSKGAFLEDEWVDGH